MERIMKFRRQARECRRLAQDATNPRIRAAMNDIAETWETLADDRERYLRRSAGRRAARDFRFTGAVQPLTIEHPA